MHKGFSYFFCHLNIKDAPDETINKIVFSVDGFIDFQYNFLVIEDVTRLLFIVVLYCVDLLSQT